MKDVINADEYEFEIRKTQNNTGYGLYLNHDSFSCERMLVICWTVGECRDWIFRHFIGERGTHFNIRVVE